jgi:hypothetical protein
MPVSDAPNLESTHLLEITVTIISLQKDLNDILSLYGVRSVNDLGEKIKQWELVEHPAYEDYLSAKQIQQDLIRNVEKARGLLAAIAST